MSYSTHKKHIRKHISAGKKMGGAFAIAVKKLLTFFSAKKKRHVFWVFLQTKPLKI